jgi:hypothetical protein
MHVYENAQVTHDETTGSWYISLDKTRDQTSLDVRERVRALNFDYDGAGNLLGIEII